MQQPYWIVTEVPVVAARRLCPSRRVVTDLPDDPYDLTDQHLVLPCDVDDEDSCAVVVDAVARGVPAVIRMGWISPVMREQLLDDLDRVATTEARHTVITDDQARLLRSLANGATLADAAADAGISVRTANRRLAEARRALDASTNIEAAARFEG